MEKQIKENKKVKLTHKYEKEKSILHEFIGKDEYELSVDEYYTLYSFFVTYSAANWQSLKGKDFKFYNWHANDLTKKVKDFFDIYNENFFRTEIVNLTEDYNNLDLADGRLKNILPERFVVCENRGGNKYIKLFAKIRNCLAHGKYALIYSSNDDKREKMIIMQDDYKNNVTARIVLKLETLLKLIHIIDKNNTLKSRLYNENTGKEG